MSQLRYAIRLEARDHHLAEIELRFPVDTATVELALPAWSPGSYLIRDYARFVRDLVVFGEDGVPRTATKRDKSTWSVDTRGARELHVRYAVYGHELSVRTNHVDADHAFLHGPATSVYPIHLRAAPIELEIAIPDGWTLTTAMAWAPTAPYRLAAAGIDELYDHPCFVARA